MPTLSQFYGITIKMYFRDSEHHPPHFHALYGGREAEFRIETGEMLTGRMPLRIKKLVNEWAKLHKNELQEVWDTQIFNKIKPLE